MVCAKWTERVSRTGMGLGGVVGQVSISSSEMLSVSGIYMIGSAPDGGALAGSVRAVKPGRPPASAPPLVAGGVMSGVADGEELLMNSVQVISRELLNSKQPLTLSKRVSVSTECTLPTIASGSRTTPSS
jgi:hypothetical protein